MVLNNPVLQLYYKNFGELEGIQMEFPLFLITHIKNLHFFD